jgi:beta-1,4-N-acetylglucosaminyltransferase
MSKVGKGCFVTVGATAAFDSLVAEILSPNFLQSLTRAGYTRLVVQYGKTGSSFFSSHLQESKRQLGTELDILVEGFDFEMGDFTQTIRNIVGGSEKGLLVAHAGIGIFNVQTFAD